MGKDLLFHEGREKVKKTTWKKKKNMA